jgi:hypothetical protein
MIMSSWPANRLRKLIHTEAIGAEFLWPGRFHARPHISTRRSGRLLKERVGSIGLETSAYGRADFPSSASQVVNRGRTGNAVLPQGRFEPGLPVDRCAASDRRRLVY